MDTIGTFEMAEALGRFNALVALHKYYDVKDLVAFFQTDASRSALFTIGTSQEDWDKLAKVKDQVSVSKINIDVANVTRNNLSMLSQNCVPKILLPSSWLGPSLRLK